MIEKTYSGTFKLENLAAQLYAAFPAWKPVMVAGRTLDPFYFMPVTGGVTIGVPDGTDTAVVDTTVSAHDPNALTDAENLRAQVVTILQSAVGISVTALTTAQRNAVLVAIAYKLGALDKDLIVQPPGKWL